MTQFTYDELKAKFMNKIPQSFNEEEFKAWEEFNMQRIHELMPEVFGVYNKPIK